MAAWTASATGSACWIAMRIAIRRRDLFASPSLRYADPRIGLLAAPAWEAARPAICRTLGLSTDAPAEVARLAGRLDAAYRDTAANLPENAAVHGGRRRTGAVRPRQAGGARQPGRAQGGGRRAPAAGGSARTAAGNARPHRLCRRVHPCQRRRRAGRRRRHQHLRRAAGRSLQHRASSR